MDIQVKVAILSIAVVIPISIFGVWASGQPTTLEQKTGGEKITVIASFYPVFEFAKQVGGNQVSVSMLMPPGVEPHDWEPSIQDIQRMSQADIIVINGVGFEGWLDQVNLINSDVMIIDSSKGIAVISSSDDEDNEIMEDHAGHDDSLADPHIWLNPLFAKIQVENIANGLKEKDPANANYYMKNANQFLEKLDHLDLKIKKDLSSCKRDFVAFHNAFSYFAHQYGLHQHTIVKSDQTHSEPTPKSLEQIITLAKKLNLKIIFTEEGVDTRISQVIASELNGKVMTLSPLEVVENGSGYIESMEKNLSALKEALCN